jgi:hypothetical protein
MPYRIYKGVLIAGAVRLLADLHFGTSHTVRCVLGPCTFSRCSLGFRVQVPPETLGMWYWWPSDHTYRTTSRSWENSELIWGWIWGKDKGLPSMVWIRRWIPPSSGLPVLKPTERTESLHQKFFYWAPSTHEETFKCLHTIIEILQSLP